MMEKPKYELGPLRAAVIQARTNIDAFQRGIAREEEHIKELESYIEAWVEYNKWLSSSIGSTK